MWTNKEDVLMQVANELRKRDSKERIIVITRDRSESRRLKTNFSFYFIRNGLPRDSIDKIVFVHSGYQLKGVIPFLIYISKEACKDEYVKETQVIFDEATRRSFVYFEEVPQIIVGEYGEFEAPVFLGELNESN